MKIYHLTTLFLLSYTVIVFGQKPTKYFLGEVSKDQNQFKQFNIAQMHFDEGNFADALEEFLNLQQEYPNQIYYDYMVAINYILVGENYAEAIKLIEKTKKIEPNYQDIDYYLGKAYQLNGNYTQAIQSFNNFLKTKPKKEKELRARRAIEECENATNNNSLNTEIRIENLGPPINSAASEYVPLISTDESILIFTYRGERSKGGKQNEFHEPDPYGHYYEDIFISYKLGNNWLEAEGISEKINTKEHDACVGLSADGQRLFIFKSTLKDGGDLYESFFDGNDWSEPKNLGPSINTKYWEGSCSISADGRTLYFSSDRPGGFGGKDLYKSVLQEDGTWGKPVNLGPVINTKYDEDSPFIHPDGETFYFSSKGHNTLGEYDIYRSHFINDACTTPENLGPPINTSGNDIYYVVNASGLVGYYSSGKKGGLGLQDIYRVTPGITGKLPVLAILKGTTTYKEKVMATNIRITDITENKFIGNYQTNAITGKFLISLKAGSEYAMELSSAAAPNVKQIINLTELEQFVETVIDIDLNEVANEKLSNNESFIQTKINEQIIADNEEKKLIQKDSFKVDGNPNKNEQDLQIQQSIFMNSPLFKDSQKIYGDKAFIGTTFKIEHNQLNEKNELLINALKKESGYNELVDDKGNIHYQIGSFSTINEAMNKRQILLQTYPELINSFIIVQTPERTIPIKQFLSEEVLSSSETNHATLKVTETAGSNNKLTDDKAVSKTEKATAPPPGDSFFESRQQSQLNYMSSNSYEQAVAKYGNYTRKDIQFSVEIISEQNINSPSYKALEYIEKPTELTDSRGNLHHLTKTFNTLSEANAYRQKLMQENPELGNSFVVVYDSGNLRTVKDFIKETMLAQMGIEPREEEKKNNLKIVSINGKLIDEKTDNELTFDNPNQVINIYPNENSINKPQTEIVSNNNDSIAPPKPNAVQEESRQVYPETKTEPILNDLIITRDTKPNDFAIETDSAISIGEVRDTISSKPTTAKQILSQEMPKTIATIVSDNQQEELDEDVINKSSIKANNENKVHTDKKEESIVGNIQLVNETQTPKTVVEENANKASNSKKLISNNTPKTYKTKNIETSVAIAESNNPQILAYYVNKDLNNPLYYNQLIENFGNTTKSNLIFKVQIGAYRFPKNFDYSSVSSFGEVTATPYPDGITRFTQLEHKTLKEAEDFRQVIIKAGIKDAWITVFYNNKRLLLTDAIKLGLLAETYGN